MKTIILSIIAATIAFFVMVAMWEIAAAFLLFIVGFAACVIAVGLAFCKSIAVWLTATCVAIIAALIVGPGVLVLLGAALLLRGIISVLSPG